jgi:hypothetical protein
VRDQTGSAALPARVLPGLAAVGILLVAAWGVLFIMLVVVISARAPDPFIASGDPCCGHPDTWSEVAWGVALALGYVLLDALLVCVAIALLGWAATRRWPRLKRLALLPGGAALAAIIVLAIVIVPQLDEGVTAPDCDTFSLSRAALRSGEDHERKTMAYGVARCDLVDGKTSSQVRRLLGKPTTHGRVDDRKTYWGYGGLNVYFVGGRVVRTYAGGRARVPSAVDVALCVGTCSSQPSANAWCWRMRTAWASAVCWRCWCGLSWGLFCPPRDLAVRGEPQYQHLVAREA